ncbi:uncharacterized protein LOC129295047 [Prosopis cineraria]|uniref:uncharacterized protein LOC129295047 n=1 Tax=Prosopis cineraria TaxID=364024 RepID=UPI0024109386|nr:uncharacterized protein LOC129295047 [Prosopis cineraria]
MSSNPDDESKQQIGDLKGYGSEQKSSFESGKRKAAIFGDSIGPATKKMSESAEDPIPAMGETLPVQDLLCLRRIRDFLCLILSYPKKPYYDDEKFLKEWMIEVSLLRAQYCSQEALQRLVSESPLKDVKGIIPEDITEQIKNGGSIIFNKSNSKELASATSKDPPPNHVPQPILDLATRLAVHQLAQIFSPESRGNSFYWMGAHVVCLSTRNDAEKQAVVEGIKANLRSGATFESHQIVHLSQMDKIDDASMRGYLSTTSRRSRKLVLLVDGDGDKRVDLRKVLNTLLNRRYFKNAAVIITTGSSALQNDELNYKADLIRIRTEDHVLPWEVFCKNVGRELVYSSGAIQRVAVQIVEECGGHLHDIVYVAELLKDVEDVQIWNQTLQKLRNSILPSYSRTEFKRFVPGNRVQDLPSLVRIRDLVHLILSYNMKLGHENLMVEWINGVSDSRAQQGSQERLRHCQSESPLRHVKGIIPEDIIEQIINGGSIIFKHAPSPILGLSYRLAVAQLVQFLSVLYHRFYSTPVVWFSTRNDLEKQTVVEDIKANFQIGKTFETLQTIYLDRLDEEFLFFDVSMWTTETDRARRWREYYEFEVLELPGQYKRHRNLILLVDGDGDKRVDLQRVHIPPDIRDSTNAFIIITTGSSILQNAELAYEVGVRIKTEDHVLPWVSLLQECRQRACILIR